MNEVTSAVIWEAHEHNHFEKGNDWYWILWILAFSAAIAAFFFGNYLLSILILVGACVFALLAAREPKIIEFAVTTRGLRLGDKLYPYSTLESYFIDEQNQVGPQLLVKARQVYMPLIIMPIPEEYIDEIDDLLIEKLPQEELEEPLANVVLEFFRF